MNNDERDAALETLGRSADGSVTIAPYRFLGRTTGFVMLAEVSDDEPPERNRMVVHEHDMTPVELSTVPEWVTPIVTTVDCGRCEGSGWVVHHCSECDDEHECECGDCGGTRTVPKLIWRAELAENSTFEIGGGDSVYLRQLSLGRAWAGPDATAYLTERMLVLRGGERVALTGLMRRRAK